MLRGKKRHWCRIRSGVYSRKRSHVRSSNHGWAWSRSGDSPIGGRADGLAGVDSYLRSVSTTYTASWCEEVCPA